MRPPPKPTGLDGAAGPAVEPALIDEWALAYLGRYASTAENLRHVLLRRVRRRVGNDGEAARAAGVLIDALVARYRATGTHRRRGLCRGPRATRARAWPLAAPYRGRARGQGGRRGGCRFGLGGTARGRRRSRPRRRLRLCPAPSSRPVSARPGWAKRRRRRSPARACRLRPRRLRTPRRRGCPRLRRRGGNRRPARGRRFMTVS